jgi:ech hydrogenase subunit D
MDKNMNAIQDFREITASELLPTVRNLKEGGYRFVQMCGITQDDGAIVMYSFDKDYEMTNYKLHVKDGETVESITGSYWNAFVYENEVHDLFGIEFLHSALDFHGNFFKTAEPTPWKKK